MSVFRRRDRWVVQVYDGVLGRMVQVGTYDTRREARTVEAEHYGRAPSTRRRGIIDHGIGHALYRCFSADGELLYIGITSRGRKRFDNHAKDQVWWRQCSRIEIEHLETRAEALLAEAEAIKTECPTHNVLLRDRSLATAASLANPLAEQDCASIDPAGGAQGADLEKQRRPA
jgi:predicted GIY-YIG superfamily endonuclease